MSPMSTSSDWRCASNSFSNATAAEDKIADGLSSCSIKEAAAPAKPLAEANREMVTLGFGGDDEDF